MIFALSFYMPDAIVTGITEVPYVETMERIDAITARAIVGHMADGKTPRDFGSRDSWLSVIFELIKYNSGITGK
jgi:hypothetical protein